MRPHSLDAFPTVNPTIMNNSPIKDTMRVVVHSDKLSNSIIAARNISRTPIIRTILPNFTSDSPYPLYMTDAIDTSIPNLNQPNDLSSSLRSMVLTNFPAHISYWASECTQWAHGPSPIRSGRRGAWSMPLYPLFRNALVQTFELLLHRPYLQVPVL